VYPHIGDLGSSKTNIP